MKKVIATVLALGMTALLFTACGDDTDPTTTEAPVVETTTEAPSATTATPTPTETTTAKQNLVFVDKEMVDNADYGYYVRYVRNENDEIIGVAVHGWKSADAVSDLVIDSEYAIRNTLTGKLDTYPVVQVGVGQGVLSFQSKLESITIPASVTKIANKAFPSCTKLKTLTLSEGLTSIGEMAFWNCPALESLVIPSTVTEIGNNAFADCVGLKSVTLPRIFENQINDIFAGCENMTITYID